MTINTIIDRWKLNHTLLASKLGMLKGTFNNKLSENHPTKFSPQEIEKLKLVLIEMKIDLSKLENSFDIM